MDNDPRIKIITGHFGSGKTEISINLSLIERKRCEKVAINDLDVINPYFRPRDIGKYFDDLGIELISPKGQFATSDLPIVSGEIYRVIHDPNYKVIIDVGGDKDGATALGQYYNDLKNLEHQMYFIVNINRPYTSNVSGITETIRQVELASRLKVSGLINNTNLGIETTIDNIDDGYQITKKASDELNIPFLYTTISEHLESVTKNFANKHEVLYIKRFMKLPWE